MPRYRRPSVPLHDALSRLTDAARAVHGEADAARAASWTVATARTSLDADAAGVCLFARTGEARWWTEGEPALASLGDPRLSDLLAPAAQGQTVVHVPHLSANRRLAARLPLEGAIEDLLAVPLSAPDGVVGVLVVAASQPRRFGPDGETFARSLAGHLAVAVANLEARDRLVELHRVQDEVVSALQHAVRPPELDVENVEMDVAYLPAGENTPTGGDLYDWILLPDGTLHVVVIDVMGKGVEATKDAVATTHALRALSLSHPLEELIAETALVMEAQNPELVATLVVVHHDPETGRTLVAGAGHPPPLLVRNGVVTEVDAPGVPLGFPGGGSHGVAELVLERGDSLVLYTDGLIEATKDIIAGLASLARAAEACAAYPAREMALALVERSLAGAARRDDSLALVIRRRVPPAQRQRALGPFEHRMTRALASVPLGRHLLLDWLRELPVDDLEAKDLALVATELCTNAVRHGGEVITLRARAEDAAVVLEVSDDGDGFTLPHRDDMGVNDAESGRGLRLVASVCDDVELERRDGITTVRATRRAVVPRP